MAPRQLPRAPRPRRPSCHFPATFVGRRSTIRGTREPSHARRVARVSAASGADWRRAARSAVVVLAAYAGGLLLLYTVLEQGPTGIWRTVDVVLGGAACLLLVARHRAPLAVGVTLAVAASLIATAGVANMVALYFVARYRSLPIAVSLAVANVVAGCVFWLVYPDNMGLSVTLTVNAAIAAAVT